MTQTQMLKQAKKEKNTKQTSHTLKLTITKKTIEGKYSLESTDSREIRAPPQLTIALKLSYYLFIARSFLST